MSGESVDFTLLRRAIAGDRGALSQLLLAQYEDLRRHVQKRLSDEPPVAIAPEDILQQVFIRAALAIRRFEPRDADSFRAWLWTIAGNLVRDAQKRGRRERRSGCVGDFVDSDRGERCDPAARGLDQLATESTSPSMQVHRRDSMQRLRSALEKLPDEQREVIERYYLRHESLDEIALAMNRSRDSVRGICFRARQNLRGTMGRSSLFFSR